MTEPLPVYLEVGTKRVFACALDWPGWARSGRDEGAALDALLAYRDRYAAVVARAGVQLPGAVAVDVVERLVGNATTDFGAPGVPPATDARTLNAEDLARLTKLLVASWEAFDKATAAASGAVLRVGPRGGGRSLARIEAHVPDAEAMYLGALGSRTPRPGGWAAQRKTVLATLTAVAQGRPVPDPSKTHRRWSPRFFVRRAASHILDHAWEIEDRSW